MPPLSSIINTIPDSAKSPVRSSFIISNAPSASVDLDSAEPSAATRKTDPWADALERIEASIASFGTGLTIDSNNEVATEFRDDNKGLADDELDQEELTVAEVEISPEQLQAVARALRARGVQVEEAELLGRSGGNDSRSSTLATFRDGVFIALIVVTYGLTWTLWSKEKSALRGKIAILKGLKRKQDETERRYFARFTQALVELQEETERELAKITATAIARKAKTAAKEVSAKVFFRVCKGYNQMRASASGGERRHHSGWYRLDLREGPRRESQEVLLHV